MTLMGEADTLTRDAFRDLLALAVEQAVLRAQQEVNGPVPEGRRYKVLAFGQNRRALSLEEALDLLYADGSFPRIIDVTVCGVADDCTVIGLLPSGHSWVRDITETWNQPAGMGPFKPLGIMLPYRIYERPRPLSLDDLREASR